MLFFKPLFIVREFILLCDPDQFHPFHFESPPWGGRFTICIAKISFLYQQLFRIKLLQSLSDIHESDVAFFITLATATTFVVHVHACSKHILCQKEVCFLRKMASICLSGHTKKITLHFHGNILYLMGTRFQCIGGKFQRFLDVFWKMKTSLGRFSKVPRPIWIISLKESSIRIPLFLSFGD